MTTVKQDREFIESIIGSDLLQNAIDWIRKNLSPDEVFDDNQLTSWAIDNGFTEN